jgi:hypothetical protein
LTGLLSVLAAIGVVAIVISDIAIGSLLPFGTVSGALLAGTFLSIFGAFCALVVGLCQNVCGPAAAAPRSPSTTYVPPRRPSRYLAPTLLLLTLLAGALGLAGLQNHLSGQSDELDTVGFGASRREAQPRGARSDPAPTAPPSAREDPGGQQLPDGYNAIAVDEVRRQVFVSSAQANVVSVLDFDGRLVHTIKGIAGPGALLVDGDRLFVVSTTAGRIDVLNASTFKPLARYGEGTLVKPGPLVKAGGRLWTSTGSCGAFKTMLVSINPVSGATVVHPLIDGLSYCIELTASTSDPNLLLAFQPGLSPPTIVRLDVSGSPTVATSRREEELSNLKQLAFLPRGDRFVAASGAPFRFLEFRTADLAESGIEYPAEPYPNAVATTGARDGLIAAGISSIDGPDVYMYPAGEPGRRLSTFTLKASQELMDRGLAWTADGKSLFAVSGSFDGTNIRLHVILP